ncbi:MAG: hypothetical protein ACRCT6_10670 [Notoacmeibacter sp.]
MRSNNIVIVRVVKAKAECSMIRNGQFASLGPNINLDARLGAKINQEIDANNEIERGIGWRSISSNGKANSIDQKYLRQFPATIEAGLSVIA